MDGRPLAKRMLEEARTGAERLLRDRDSVPTLATVVVGDSPASASYVRMKQKKCAELGLISRVESLPAGTGTDEVVERVESLGRNPEVHGILVQHPVPPPIDKRRVFESIVPGKDVDGVTSGSLGQLILGLPGLVSCTASGIMELLREYGVELKGTHAVVLGRSPILGRPMASLLINAHATVTLCHSHTQALDDLVRQADVLIAAVGKPRFVRGDWIKPGAVVVDAGYNPGNVGDVDFDSASSIASRITPVPGGVGPLTIATLMKQTVKAAARQLGLDL